MLRIIFAISLLLAVSDAATEAPLFGKIINVSDGDTVTILTGRNQHRLRLTEIDAPERGQPWGRRATQALSEKINQQEVVVLTAGKDRYNRVLGRVIFDGRDINREMVAEGHAWVYRDYMTDGSFLKDEEAARTARLGLWGISEPPVEPWAWRRGARTSIRATNTESSEDDLFEDVLRIFRDMGNETEPTSPSVSGREGFTCGAKYYCRDMSSCAEARFYLEECGLSRLDGDSDGIPCESICR